MPNERWQKLRTHVAIDRLDLDPPEPGPLEVSNLVRRVFAYLFVKNGQNMVQVEGTAAGELKTVDPDVVTATEAIQALLGGTLKVDDDESQVVLAAIATLLEGTLSVEASAQIPNRIEDFEGTLAADVWTGLHSFAAESRSVTCTCETHPCWFEFLQPDNGAWGPFFLPADTGISLDLRSIGFRVKNYGAGNNAKWQVISTRVG